MSLTPQLVVTRIMEDVARRGHTWSPETIDGFKFGDPERPVTGIAVTWMATVDVVRAAADAGASFVITHEPTFWNHLDAPPQDGTDASLYTAKTRLLEELGMTIWRFHDHHHFAFDRDPVLDDFFERLGWLASTSGNSIGARTDLEPIRLADLAEHLARRLDTRAVRIVGDPDLLVRTVGYGAHDLASCIDALRGVDVIVMGEVREWDAFEYFRDASLLAERKALIDVSHAAVESGSATGLANWLRGIVPEVPVIDIRVPEPYQTFAVGS